METQANTLNSPILSSAPTTETLDMSTLNLSDKVDESEEKGTETEDFGKDDSNDDIEDEHECKLYCIVQGTSSQTVLSNLVLRERKTDIFDMLWPLF